MNSRVIVARISDDELNEKTWVFRLVSDTASCRVVIEYYVEVTRRTKRHRWRTLARYDIASKKQCTLSRPATPPPDVFSEATQKLIEKISTAMARLARQSGRAEERQLQSKTYARTRAA